jgi:GTP-binding protein EngB required for normal cell division
MATETAFPADAAPLDRQLEPLAAAAALGEGRIPEETVAAARRTLERAGARRRLSADHTVVGFFGATGSGKSSLFNAVAGRNLARVAVLRPTTSEPLAAVWGAAGSDPLLDWLDVATRHRLDGPVPGTSAEGTATADAAPSGPWARLLGNLRRRAAGRASTEGASADTGGLILLDLPDFDSIAAAHREIATRLAGQVDVLVWVLDPQKYADDALHRDFLEPLAAHRSVTLVVLNQVDRLSTRDTPAVLASLRDILAQDGLARVPLFPASAATGEGVDALRSAIAEVATRRAAATERLAADVRTASRALAAHDDGGSPAGIGPGAEDRLVDALAEAAGVHTVVRAVHRSYRLEASRRTGWPVVRWLARVRQDPLRRLGLRRDRAGGTDPTGPRPAADDPRLHRTSLPARGPAHRAQAEGALRAFADDAGAGAPEAWRASIRRAARSHAAALEEDLDQAITSTDLQAGATSWWWQPVNALQWLALLAAVAGFAWLGMLALAAYLQFEVPPAPDVEGFPVPTLMAVGGVAAGLAVALLTAPFVRWGANARARRARRRLQAAIAAVAHERVAEPVRAEIDRHTAFRAAVAAAGGPP